MIPTHIQLYPSIIIIQARAGLKHSGCLPRNVFRVENTVTPWNNLDLQRTVTPIGIYFAFSIDLKLLNVLFTTSVLLLPYKAPTVSPCFFSTLRSKSKKDSSKWSSQQSYKTVSCEWIKATSIKLSPTRPYLPNGITRVMIRRTRLLLLLFLLFLVFLRFLLFLLFLPSLFPSYFGGGGGPLRNFLKLLH